MKASIWTWVLFCVAAGALALGIVRWSYEAERQAQALAKARRENLELNDLRVEHRRLAEQTPSVDERSLLQRRHAAAEALRARIASLQRSVDAVGAPDSKGQPDRERLPAEAWVNSGRANPTAAFESVLWAASHGDVEQLAGMLAFNPAVRAEVDALFSQLPEASREEFGSPEKVVATLVAGSFPKDASAMTPLGEVQSGNGAAMYMRIERSDGPPKDTLFQFQQAADGWRLVIPANIMTGFEKSLAAPPS